MIEKKDNTAFLIRTGNFLVTLPAVLCLFMPTLLVFLRGVTGKGFHFGYFLLAMLAGVILSFFMYRFTSRWWLSWALARSVNLPALKRKAIQHHLVSENGRTLFSNNSTLGEALSYQLDAIDDQVATADDPALPAEKKYARKTNNRVVAWVSLLMFVVASLCMLIFLEQPSAWDVLRFTPFLIISIVFFLKKEKSTTILTLNAEGMLYAAGFVPWREVEQVRFRRRKSGGGTGHNRTTISARDIRYLEVTFKNGDTKVISMNDMRVSHTIEDVIAVYRYRHSQQFKKAGAL
ncbi:MAG TPA: hypothetical protein PKC69_01405 [Chitinophagaceae bacterium]|nr:hypothetical protein [Chitinophagaceae bacterium]